MLFPTLEILDADKEQHFENEYFLEVSIHVQSGWMTFLNSDVYKNEHEHESNILMFQVSLESANDLLSSMEYHAPKNSVATDEIVVIVRDLGYSEPMNASTVAIVTFDHTYDLTFLKIHQELVHMDEDTIFPLNTVIEILPQDFLRFDAQVVDVEMVVQHGWLFTRKSREKKKKLHVRGNYNQLNQTFLDVVYIPETNFHGLDLLTISFAQIFYSISYMLPVNDAPLIHTYFTTSFIAICNEKV